ncbi:MAG: excinuclease ABC subunit UvrB [Turicibacter sp.]|jgi:excinuclease ABC subunit B|uniref:UvrABC system protein B n=1 Tax=Turicibacter faecis TaxID=2963365 RepID=A0ABN6ZDA9_9FIRM|nr:MULTISPECIES: excinuclease ABC subunit UvrB [unclassified Turicibacter]MCI8701533.1 excinuclease ABC subunit UvrB [Turicibacter sp.]BEH91700.1 UvrABC system protein B [Turicibacter sp. TC023]MCI9350674.1 excinuclease ABC subunit UvrB [Turicibacter sp.]MCU7205290.1 excinuclease ABC subunit UvrB [Turicibacter sp. TA25]MCU7209946.1 excinuclease ABC subunit UvrB [Turicibacter sp. 1E2]
MKKGKFEIVSKYSPSGDQPQAIKSLVENIESGVKEQVLLGATGTGKTFTIANVVQQVNKPTLVLAHNKTLAGQLYSELKEFFPNNAVEYFVSYYDYYQPEAYVPSSDTFIEKDAKTNDEIDKLRHSATAALLERNDVIVVASVSCIYGIGDPEEYKKMMVSIRVGMEMERNDLLNELVRIQYQRNDIDFHRGTFRVRGDIVEILPIATEKNAIRIEFFGEEVDRIREIDTITGEVLSERKHVVIFPASHFVTGEERMKIALKNIEEELEQQVKYFESEGKLLEAQRIEQRTRYDLEMMAEMGFCSGVENYSGPLSLRERGATPYCLLDFFPEDWLLVADESHVTLPQVRGMYNGDRARKETLVNHGFRLPSALDNRPLQFNEFEDKIHQAIYVSATPGDYELARTDKVIEQIIRPTGLLDPVIELHPSRGQIDHLVSEIYKRIEKNERVLVTTLTIKMSEELTNYLKELGIKVAYLHSEIKTLERIEIIRDLRIGTYDVLVGINLLREGLDIPEVSLVAILDADKEGFLRSDRSLIQTIGRAARNAQGRVILYADKITGSMRRAMDETARRREIQEKYNEDHGIIPMTVHKDVRDLIRATEVVEKEAKYDTKMSRKEKEKLMKKLEREMKEAAKALDFETAATLRDAMLELKIELGS